METRNVWREKASRSNNPKDWSPQRNLKRQVRNLITRGDCEFVKDQIESKGVSRPLSHFVYDEFAPL